MFLNIHLNQGSDWLISLKISWKHKALSKIHSSFQYLVKHAIPHLGLVFSVKFHCLIRQLYTHAFSCKWPRHFNGYCITPLMLIILRPTARYMYMHRALGRIPRVCPVCVCVHVLFLAPYMPQGPWTTQ